MNIDKIMKEINAGYYSVRMISNEVYRVETNEGKYIIKINAPPFLRRMINNVKRAKDITFKNEISFYQKISEKSFERFKHPMLIKSDGKKYIVLEYITGTDGWNRDIISRQHLICALLEFQLLGVPIREPLVKRILKNWYRKVPCKALKWAHKLIRRPADLVIWLKCIIAIIKGIIVVKKVNYIIFNHNDLFYCNNLITTNDGNLYFYDFEYVIAENKWFLTDIFDLSFDLETLELDSELLCEYIYQLKSKITGKEILRHMEMQTKVILIRKLLGVIVSSRTKEANKIACRNFIKDILLSEKGYKLWYEKNIKEPLFSF